MYHYTLKVISGSLKVLIEMDEGLKCSNLEILINYLLTYFSKGTKLVQWFLCDENVYSLNNITCFDRKNNQTLLCSSIINLTPSRHFSWSYSSTFFLWQILVTFLNIWNLHNSLMPTHYLMKPNAIIFFKNVCKGRKTFHPCYHIINIQAHLLYHATKN